MRIAHLTITFLPTVGGAQSVVHMLALKQHKLGHKVTVVTPWNSCQAVKRLVPYTMRPLIPLGHRLSWKSAYSRLAREVLKRQLRREQMHAQFDVWHVHEPYPSASLLLAALGGGPGTVLTCHNADIMEPATWTRDARKSEAIAQTTRHTLQTADVVTALSESMLQKYLELGVQRSNACLIGNAIDSTRFDAVPMSDAQLRDQWGVSPERRILLTVGRNVPVKGYHVIPSVINELESIRNDVTWVIVGDGSDRVAHGTQGQGCRILPLPPISAAGSDFAAGRLPPDTLVNLQKFSDLYVSTSQMESFGCVLLEAMASGVPIVAADAPGVSELIRESGSGRVVPQGDPRAMAVAIDQLLCNPTECQALGEHGKAAAASRDWQTAVAAYMRAYEDAREAVACRGASH